jgi:hypothetical protein
MRITTLVLALALALPLNADTHKWDYKCFFVDANGTVKTSGYLITFWFDTSVTARILSAGEQHRGIDCDFDIFPPNPNDLVFNCTFNPSRLKMTLSINKDTLKARQKKIGDPQVAQLQCSKS